MFNKIIFAIRFLRYLLKSNHYYGHGIHSPFIYDFVRNVLFKKSNNTKLAQIRHYKKQLKQNKQIINFKDLGAGSKLLSSSNKKISAIAATSSTRKKYGQLLSRIVSYYKPQTIIELGTSLGIGTLYLSVLMSTDAEVYTIEGDENVSKIAHDGIKKISKKNIQFINAKFENALTELIAKKNSFDLVFFDGNHSENATINYFEKCLSNINDQSIFVFDDIHWSKGMENAWDYIKLHQKTKVCIDLFQFGIVFFRKELTKQNYVIRY
jgi:predicted O-methyltransferase YrrM